MSPPPPIGAGPPPNDPGLPSWLQGWRDGRPTKVRVVSERAPELGDRSGDAYRSTPADLGATAAPKKRPGKGGGKKKGGKDTDTDAFGVSNSSIAAEESDSEETHESVRLGPQAAEVARGLGSTDGFADLRSHQQAPTLQPLDEADLHDARCAWVHIEHFGGVAGASLGLDMAGVKVDLHIASESDPSAGR